MRVVETKVYQYGELSERAKGKARDWYREASADDNHYAEFIIEDAQQVAACLGIEFRQRDVKTYSGNLRQASKACRIRPKPKTQKPRNPKPGLTCRVFYCA